jgi:ABC-type phosphate transport system auxiliary subunit
MTTDEMKQIKGLVDESAADTKRHFDEKAVEMGRHFDESAADTKHHFDEKAAETQRHFDVVAESLRADIRIIAEGHVMLNEKMDRMRQELRDEMRSGFDEVRSAIRFSYAEIDRRVSTLESHVVALTSRLERVEALVVH